jgi:hypothetical protein
VRFVRSAALGLVIAGACLLACFKGASPAARVAADGDAQAFDLVASDGSGPYGHVDLTTGADEFVVTVYLAGARAPGNPYGVSACHVDADGSLACVPTGTPLGSRQCQTQTPNSGVVYCGWVDADGNWFSAGVLQRFVFAGLPFDPNLVLIWNVNDGADYYRADLAPDLPDGLILMPWLPAPAPDDN